LIGLRVACLKKQKKAGRGNFCSQLGYLLMLLNLNPSQNKTANYIMQKYLILNQSEEKVNMCKYIKNLKLITMIIGVIWMPITLSAQYGSSPTFVLVDGYVILSNGDTLNGQLKWKLKYVENNPVEIKFVSENGATKVFNASEIPGFGNYIRPTKEDFDTQLELQREDYVSMPSFKKGIPVFYNKLLDGRIKIYLNRSSLQSGGDKIVEISKFDGISFGFSRDEGLTIGPTYRTSYKIIEGRVRNSSYFVSKDNEALIKVEKDNFDTVFTSLFEDCPEIQLELEKNPELRKFKNFMLLAEVYNHICK